MFCICLIDVQKLPEDDLREIKTHWSFDGLYVKIYIIFTHSAYVDIT
jgi:hypothetical protein